MNGKGSRDRTADRVAYAANWERIFGASPATPPRTWRPTSREDFHTALRDAQHDHVPALGGEAA